MKNQMKAKRLTENLSLCIPVRAESIAWSADGDGMVTLDVKNAGAFNKIAQVFFKRPKVSHIHLDKLGSSVWQKLDGETDLLSIANSLENECGETVYPTLPRLRKFISILKNYHFIYFK